MAPSPLTHCPQCGAAIPEASEHGLCPRCVFAKAMQPTVDLGIPATVPPDLDTVREAFPHLEVIELIGSGGMGSVFKARQPQLDRFVALKILPGALADQPGFSERFQREAKALAKLSHPHIVTVHDHGQAGGLYYLLMEFVDGVNLRQLIQTKRLTPKEALSIVPPICDALQCAHDHGIVHRDIKPENLLIDKAGKVKIADFGIAKIVENGQPEAKGGSEESTGSAVTLPLGTPDYAAPEQSEGTADHRADIYSLGVVLYEMLTGERPRENFVPPSKRVQVDIRIDEIVLRALEKTPELRFQTAADFRTRVEAMTINDASPPSVQSNGETSPSRFSRTAIAGACVAALGLLSLFLSAFMDKIVPGTAMPSGEAPPAAFALVGAALLYAFFATLLGWIAVSQIRRSGGRIYGLQLAVFDGLVFPLLTLSAAIAMAAVALAKMFVDFYANPSAVGSSHISVVTRMANWLSLNQELAVIAGVMAAIVVNVLIVRAVLKGVTPASTPVASGPKGKEAQAASISIIFALIATALGALAAIRHGSAWPPMALSLLFAGLSILMALPGRRLAVGKCALIIAALGIVIWPVLAMTVSHGRAVSAPAPSSLVLQPESTRQPMAEPYGFPNTEDFLPWRMMFGIALFGVVAVSVTVMLVGKRPA